MDVVEVVPAHLIQIVMFTVCFYSGNGLVSVLARSFCYILRKKRPKERYVVVLGTSEKAKTGVERTKA